MGVVGESVDGRGEDSDQVFGQSEQAAEVEVVDPVACVGRIPSPPATSAIPCLHPY